MRIAALLNKKACNALQPDKSTRIMHTYMSGTEFGKGNCTQNAGAHACRKQAQYAYTYCHALALSAEAGSYTQFVSQAYGRQLCAGLAHKVCAPVKLSQSQICPLEAFAQSSTPTLAAYASSSPPS